MENFYIGQNVSNKDTCTASERSECNFQIHDSTTNKQNYVKSIFRIFKMAQLTIYALVPIGTIGSNDIFIKHE